MLNLAAFSELLMIAWFEGEQIEKCGKVADCVNKLAEFLVIY